MFKPEFTVSTAREAFISKMIDLKVQRMAKKFEKELQKNLDQK